MHCAGVRPEKRCKGQFSFEKSPSRCPVTNSAPVMQSSAPSCFIRGNISEIRIPPFSKGGRITSLHMHVDGKDGAVPMPLSPSCYWLAAEHRMPQQFLLFFSSFVTGLGKAGIRDCS